MKQKRKINSFFLVFTITTILCSALLFVTYVAFAEQIVGTTPESGADSRIKKTYDGLVTLGFGSESAGSWGDWGAYWNRIRSSAEWTPSTATATEAKVVSGYTFYAGSDRTLKTGTAGVPGEYNEQKYCRYDDWLDGAGTTNENTSEESVWTVTAVGGSPVSVTDNGITVSIKSNQVYQDNLTGL